MAAVDRLGEVHFPVTASIVATLIVLLLGGIYGYTTGKIPETVLFIAAAGTGTGAVLSAFYTARGLELTAAALARDEIRDKRALAFQFTSKWNDPEMFHMREVVRGLFAMDHKDSCFQDHIKNKTTNVIHFLNFLEEVAIALEKGGADADILHEAFAGVVATAWSKLQPWVADFRTTRHRPKLWIYVENLANNWN
jgi:hypothetical protein